MSQYYAVWVEGTDVRGQDINHLMNQSTFFGELLFKLKDIPHSARLYKAKNPEEAADKLLEDAMRSYCQGLDENEK
jgi:hypothetical protein